MKRTLLLAATLGVALSARMFAALGDSESTITELFGVPVKQGSTEKGGITTKMYQKGNYVILVQFLRGLSLAESYTRADEHDFSQKEIDAFLEGSSNGRPWIKDPNKLSWERADHKAKAWCATVHKRPTLLIEVE